jgi:hypothetical protein
METKTTLLHIRGKRPMEPRSLHPDCHCRKRLEPRNAQFPTRHRVTCCPYEHRRDLAGMSSRKAGEARPRPTGIRACDLERRRSHPTQHWDAEHATWRADGALVPNPDHHDVQATAQSSTIERNRGQTEFRFAARTVAATSERNVDDEDVARAACFDGRIVTVARRYPT